MSSAGTNEVIVQEITIQAPADRIFTALTDPVQLVKWWKVEGRFEATHLEGDLRIGGKWQMRGTGFGGKAFTVKGTYREIDRPRLLVFSWLPDWQESPTESTVRIDLEEQGGVTHVRLTHSGLLSEDQRTSHRGWPLVLQMLQTYVEKHA